MGDFKALRALKGNIGYPNARKSWKTFSKPFIFCFPKPPGTMYPWVRGPKGSLGKQKLKVLLHVCHDFQELGHLYWVIFLGYFYVCLVSHFFACALVSRASLFSPSRLCSEGVRLSLPLLVVARFGLALLACLCLASPCSAW